MVDVLEKIAGQYKTNKEVQLQLPLYVSQETTVYTGVLPRVVEYDCDSGDSCDGDGCDGGSCDGGD